MTIKRIKKVLFLKPDKAEGGKRKLLLSAQITENQRTKEGHLKPSNSKRKKKRGGRRKALSFSFFAEFKGKEGSHSFLRRRRRGGKGRR